MADVKPLSTKDLFLLMVGWNRLKKPPSKADKAEDYWLDNGSLRDSEWNWEWPFSPKDAWESVRYRDWLMANIAANLTDSNQDFIAISEPLFVSLDLLPSEIKPDMPDASEAIKQIVATKSNYQRSFLTTLSVGLSKGQSDGKEVFLFGAGMRRRTRVWGKGVDEEFALQADVEFFVPFYVFAGADPPPDKSFPGARSICAGIAITRPNGSSIGVDKDGKELAAVRFNFRIPFTARVRHFEPGISTTVQRYWEPDEFETHFQAPVVEVHKREMALDSKWEKFGDWKSFVKNVCERVEGRELLNAPIGPLLLEKVSDSSGIKDIIKKREKLEEEKEEVIKELDEAVNLLKGLWDWKAPGDKPDPDNITPSPSQRRLGHMLESLGLLNGKPGEGGYFDYSLSDLAGLTVWEVVNRLHDELDGFPLYVKGQNPKDDNGVRGALTFASQPVLTNPRKHYFGLAGLAYNIPLKTAGKNIQAQEDEGKKEEGDEESTIEIKLHLGKWFDGETLDDNWFRRLLPFQREQKDDKKQANYSLALRADLLSLGVDFKGSTEDGLLFVKNKGPLSYFHLGVIEARIALLFSGERVVFGVGVKLKDMRLSLGPKATDDKKKDDKASGDEILEGLQGLLDDDWAVVPAPKKPEERNIKTRLSAKKKDKFSISVGYLTPLSEGGHHTLDVQLYDEKGNRGKLIWIPIDRRSGTVYLKHIGIGLKGIENVELGEKLAKNAQLTFALTGGLRWSAFELGFIGAKLIIPLANPGSLQISLDGLDVSLKIDKVVISGSFLNVGLEFAGSLTIDAPQFSIGAMGFYGNLRVFTKPFASAVVADLRNGRVHNDLRDELGKKQITPADDKPINQRFSFTEWELRAADDKRYILVDEDGKLTVLSPDKTFFMYAMFNAASGCGIDVGPIQFTGFAIGLGFNRRIIIPRIEKVAEFPLVQMVMGEGGYQKGVITDDIRNQMSKPLEDPVSVLEKMKDHLPAERGHDFFCIGARFTIARTGDCFGLIILRRGDGFEIALLGLARFRQPSDLSAKPLCYVEMQILMSINPKEGCFKLQALLTSNSWVLSKDCKLTGGFALFVWFDGAHKGDFVITLGGYHPRFQKPDHYPVVPRLGLNWPVSDQLSIKGGVYLAFTPSCCMVGARLEATFSSDRVSVWFTAYLDAVIAWSPFHFEVDIGLSLRIEVAFFLFTLKVTISATLQLWGPPVAGLARIDLTLISFDVPIGNQSEKTRPELIKSWSEFSRSFLNASEADKKAIDIPINKPADKPLIVSPIMEPNLVAGRNNLNNLPKTETTPPEAKREDAIWKVRGDELELAASASVPVTTLNVGRVKTRIAPEGIRERSLSGKSLLVPEPVALDGLREKKSGSELGVHPMGKTLQSVLNVTVVRDDVSQTRPVDLSEWVIEEETNSLPAALWDAAKPKLDGPSEPSAKLIPDCITGIKRLKPPAGKRGQKVDVSEMHWSQLERVRVPRSDVLLKSPSVTRSRNVQAAVAGKQAEQKLVADALGSVGFNLAWQPAQTEIRFRKLQAKPLAGAVDMPAQ